MAGRRGRRRRRSHARTSRVIARRVEALRDLRFRHPVPVAVVSPAQARREGIADYDRRQPLARRRASEELLKLLGLLPAGADLRTDRGERLRRADRRLLRPAPQTARARARCGRGRRDARARADARAGGPARRPRPLGKRPARRRRRVDRAAGARGGQRDTRDGAATPPAGRAGGRSATRSLGSRRSRARRRCRRMWRARSCSRTSRASRSCKRCWTLTAAAGTSWTSRSTRGRR